MLDPKELFVPGFGHVFVAPPDTADPLRAAVASPWQDLGYVSEDGVTTTPGQTNEEVRGWQSAFPLRYIVTEKTLVSALSFMQINVATLSLFFGGAGVTGSGGDYDLAPPPPSLIDFRSWLFEGTDGVRTHRLYYKRALLSETGDWQWTRSGAAALPVTVAMQADETGGGWAYHTIGDTEFTAT